MRIVRPADQGREAGARVRVRELPVLRPSALVFVVRLLSCRAITPILALEVLGTLLLHHVDKGEVAVPIPVLVGDELPELELLLLELLGHMRQRDEAEAPRKVSLDAMCKCPPQGLLATLAFLLGALLVEDDPAQREVVVDEIEHLIDDLGRALVVDHVRMADDLGSQLDQLEQPWGHTSHRLEDLVGHSEDIPVVRQ